MYFLRFSDPKRSYIKYMDFSTTHHIGWYQKRLTISSARQSKNKVYRVYPSLTKIEGTVNTPVLLQQFTHLIHPDRSYRLSYLLRQIADKAGKIHNNRRQTKHKRKNTSNEQTV